MLATMALKGFAEGRNVVRTVHADEAEDTSTSLAEQFAAQEQSRALGSAGL